MHNFLQVHAETFPVIVELGAEVFLACSCSTRSKCSLLFLRRGVRAIFYVSEVGFLAIARSCEALENGVSPTWISSTTALASNRSGSSSVCEISSSRQGLFSISTDFFVENLPFHLTLVENGRRVAHQVSTARLRTRLSGFQLILWRRMTRRVEREGAAGKVGAWQLISSSTW